MLSPFGKSIWVAYNLSVNKNVFFAFFSFFSGPHFSGLLETVFFIFFLTGGQGPFFFPFFSSNKSISKLPKMHSAASGHARVLAARRRSCSLEGPSFAQTLNLSEAPKALRACICVRAGCFCARTCSSERPWDAPNFDFGARDGCFFEAFICGERSMRTASDIDKTL